MSSNLRPAAAATDRSIWRDRFQAIRRQSEALATPLSAEDQTIQSMPDVSPTKWHLAHTSWFFETFLLLPHVPGYRLFDPAFGYLFNSYYEAVGDRHPRPERGLLSRPGVAEIGRYRDHVTEAMAGLIAGCGERLWRSIEPVIELGMNHEQQHQELILMDIKHVLSMSPLQPAYQAARPLARVAGRPPCWFDYPGGLVEIGYAGDGFAFDNEGPRHKVWLEPFRLAGGPVTCGDYLSFIEDGGYRNAALWLSDGWAVVQREGWTAPLYWRCDDGEWTVFTLAGRCRLDPAEPVCHVSFYEADAFARWQGRRLPTEAEWETAAADVPLAGNLADRGMFHPRPADVVTLAGHPLQLFGDVWEWTASPYSAYPRFRAAPGAIGEYNGKFMSGQMVLRGGAAVTPVGHLRATYRNFFPPAAKWPFGGIRLAEDA